MGVSFFFNSYYFSLLVGLVRRVGTKYFKSRSGFMGYSDI